MLRGISEKELYPYVPEGERGLSEEQQTVFYMKPKTGHDANVQTKVYLKAYREKDGGIRDLEVPQADAADVANFKATCKKVENFVFPNDYYEAHPQIKKMAKAIKVMENGVEIEFFCMPVIEDELQIGDVFRCLDSETIRELTSVSNSISKLKEGQKKS
ncbi:hypothetical protein D4R86_00895 [bacterium]|nr:MAG: hypothetical protein D4R86_00895 [bacterium]